MLRIGRIQYANCTPIFHAFQKHFSDTNYELVNGVPATLNSLLLQGSIDVCPSSSIEYALHPEKYLILRDLSISSNGAVKSVLLFSDRPIEELGGCDITLSAESATSVNLLKILMNQYIGCHCTYTKDTGKQPSINERNKVFLLIGDTALKTLLNAPTKYIYDLGELWKKWTGLPFVFALWICTVSAVQKHWQELCKLNENLSLAKKIATHDYEEIAALSSDSQWMGKERLIEYWRNNINYDLNTEHLQGLQLFYEKSFQLGLISRIPKLNFMQ